MTNSFKVMASRVQRLLWLPLLALGGPAVASEYAGQWGPELGSEVPMLEAYDQSGDLRALADLSGEQGLLLFLNRSADW